MSNDKSASFGGIGLTGALTVLFVALKLIPHGDGHIIDWSWWWVLSLVWISAIFAGLMMIIAAIVLAITD